MGSLGSSIADTYLAYHGRNWLDSCPLEYRSLYYQWHIDDVFVLFKSSDRLKRFQIYLNSCHVHMSLTIETEQNRIYNKRLSKTNFQWCIHPLNRCLRIGSSWSMFHQQLISLREIFQKIGYA